MCFLRSMVPAGTAIVTAILVLGSAPWAVAEPPDGTLDGTRTNAGQSSRALRLARQAAPAEVTTPLSVTIDQLTPGVLPQRGPVRVSGTVTNLDDETWHTVNIYPFLGTEPLTGTHELAEATQVHPEQDVGPRLTRGDVSDRIDEIPPGDSALFSITIPQGLLERQADGVYWFGIHALGETYTEGRQSGADGRARTFLPKVTPGRAEAVPTGVVIPLRHSISYAADGSLTHLDGWSRTLSIGGQLRSLVDLGASAGTRPVSWIVDPALVDAVSRVAAGNPPRSLAPTVEDAPPVEEQEEQPEESADARVDPATKDAAARAAGAWLTKLRRSVESGGELYTLPYGDVDVDAALDHAPALLTEAFARTSPEIESWDVVPTPVVSTPSGYLSTAGVTGAPETATVLITDRQLTGESRQAGTSETTEETELTGTDGDDARTDLGVATVNSRRVVIASSGAAAGGPGPDLRDAPLAMRQRMLAEAAVRATTGEPLTVVLPAGWHPESATGFFPSFDQPWIQQEELSGIANRPATSIPADSVSYPEEAARAELDQSAFTRARELIDHGAQLQRLLVYNDRVGEVVRGQAFTTTSYAARHRPRATEASVAASQRWIAGLLGRVRVDAPPSVTLTSQRGSFAAIVYNDLPQPITVALEVTSDRPMRVTRPPTIEVEANGRARVMIDAETTERGMHHVGLALTDSEGNRIGVADEVPIRSAEVSGIIWIFMGAGGAILFGAIAVRLYRRVRDARRAGG